MDRVIIDMSNPNVLVSLAYIKTNDNPLSVFCNYILYLLLISPSHSLRRDELKQKLLEKFGLDMPEIMIDNCTRILKRQNEIIFLPNGAGYEVKETDFDTEQFNATMTRLHQQEDTVLNSILAFLKENYNKTDWNLNDAKNYLSVFLDEEGNGARLFLNSDPRTDIDNVSPSWYIAKYIDYIQQKDDSLEKTYLEEIVNGMMIYQGVYQTNDYQQNKSQKFKGTVFYLDTKLVLRALGYSVSANVQATRELISLIRREYEGKIGVFQQTINEVENALVKAGESYQTHTLISDSELRIYAELNPVGADLFCEAATTVLHRLSQEYGVDSPTPFNWDSPEIRRNFIERSEIIDYIQSEHNWNHRAIENDVDIINQINILRKSNYSTRYGGKHKLPVFITTNTALVYTFKKYVSETVDQNLHSMWRKNCLPIISDNMFLFRLWVPYADKHGNLPALTLSRYAYSAQNADTQYFEKLRETAILYKEQNGIDATNLSEARRQKLENILVTNTNGDADRLSVEIFASSVRELVVLETEALHGEVDDLRGTVHGLQGTIQGLEGTIQSKDGELQKRDQRIIELTAKPFVNKLGVWRILIYAAKLWWLIPSTLTDFITITVDVCLDDVSYPKWKIILISVFVAVILKICDKIIEHLDIENIIVKRSVEVAWRHYSHKVLSKISNENLENKNKILEFCLENTPIFKINRKYCSDLNDNNLQ